MATRRMILSTIWEDEFIGSLSYFERCLWIGLFSRCADDQGRMLDKPVLIKSQVFPYDDVGSELIAAALDHFEDNGKIIRYSIGDRDFIQLVRWWENQNLAWAHGSKFPGPPAWTDHIREKESSGKVKDDLVEWPPVGVTTGPSLEDQQGTQEVDQQGTQEASQLVLSSVSTKSSLANTKFPDASDLDQPAPSPSPEPPTPIAPAAPTPRPEGKTKARQPKPITEKPPAVVAFFEVSHKWPPRALWPDIDRDVGTDPPNLDFWKQVVKAYIGCGWNPGNVNNMLEFYRRRERPGVKPNGGNGRAKTSSATSGQSGPYRRDGASGADIDRILAEREREEASPDTG